MNFKIIQIVAMIYLLQFSQAAFSVSVETDRREFKISLDTHFHYDYQDDKLIEAIIDSDVETTFLISRAYAVTEANPGHERSPYDASLIPIFNKLISHTVTAHPNRFVGLCGLNLKWKKELAYLVKCLNLPGMRGIKLHTEGIKISISDNSNEQNLIDILNTVRDQNRVVLWHLKEQTDSRSQIKSLIKIANEFKETGFIVAHSFWSLFKVELLANMILASKNPPENIYIEISTLRPYDMKVWKKFDFSHVLYGTDGPEFGGMAKPSTTEIPHDILMKNGKLFMQKYLN